MRIEVKTLTGKTLVFEVESSDTIMSLRHKVKEKEGIPVSEGKYHFDGKTLRNEETLKHYGIKKGDVVYLIINLRGD